MGGPEMAPQLVQARGLRPLGLPGQRSGRPGGAVAPLDPRRSGQPGTAVTPLDRALEAAARARVTLILGTSDTGKTSLTARLAGALAARGERVAVVDADVGQSEIGPPTTVGLGHVAGAVARLGDAEVIALEFVGDTSPVPYIRETADATGRLVRRALDAGFERVLVDTGGLVEGPLGLARLDRGGHAGARGADGRARGRTSDVAGVRRRRAAGEPGRAGAAAVTSCWCWSCCCCSARSSPNR